MAKLTIVAKTVAKTDSVESVKSEMLKLIAPTREEEGCIEYFLHQDNEDPTILIFYETWENYACFERHMSTQHFKNYVNTVGSMIKEKVVYKMTRVG
ncbi:putative quinol monooxygenase [Pelotalea chapellei]|uniref:Antibiotic biosynthesis monooxygenase n=1 Tax=Pelotalea chapellei TaxID=44671 RepID=A0ABS5UAZ8_9BACT|nr:putative quinol monooxygenase [Pelotalea chapellei]MBT1072838.1 antibiotic biosynthesis monooxygenase [Pelotalea chapellei]